MRQTTLFDIPTRNKCQVTFENGMLVFTSPFDASLVASIKNMIPGYERKWDGVRKAWLVSPNQADNLKKIVKQHFMEDLQVPIVTYQQPAQETRLLEVRYLGTCKLREDGTSAAWGYIDGEWRVVFLEQALRDWFEAGPVRPGEASTSTLYSILGVGQAATSDEIKTAFRRLARQWHPDVCREPDAAEQFKKINHAQQVLSNSGLRARYDAGLALSATIGSVPETVSDFTKFSSNGYRSPLRCGLIMADVTESISGKFKVENILAWEDIIENGLTLVSSWALGAKVPTENWV